MRKSDVLKKRELLTPSSLHHSKGNPIDFPDSYNLQTNRRELIKAQNPVSGHAGWAALIQRGILSPGLP
jgi:hypothetical protein